MIRAMLSSDSLEGPGDFLFLVFENGAQVEQQRVLLDAGNNGWLMAAEYFLEFLGAVLGMGNRDE
jgi:hypothetical protein